MIIRRAYYRILLINISIIEQLVGPFHIGLRQRLKYLHQLLWERRYDEFNKILVKFIFGFLPLQDQLKLIKDLFRSPFEIDARNQRYAEDGSILPKETFIFPSSKASLLCSIVIPCYNYGEYLSDAVESALRQTIFSLEVIVVDDGSTDPTTKTALEAYAGSSCVRVIRQENKGLPTTRNNGIAAAKGEYICCLDADDTIEPTYLEKCIAILEADRAVGFAYSHVRLFGDVDEIWKTRDFSIDEALINNHTSVSAVFRRDDWAAVGGYDPRMKHGYEDWEFWLSLATLGRKGRVIPEPLFNHRRHGHTMTHDAHAKRKALIGQLQELNPVLFSNCLLQKRLKRLTSSSQEKPDFQKLYRHQIAENDVSMPHLLIIVPWLPIGGAEMLLFDLLEHFRSTWRLSIVTTEKDDHVMTKQFSRLTPEIYHLHGFLEEADWEPFIASLIATRKTSLVFSSNSRFAYERLPTLKRSVVNLRWMDLLHNALPSGHIKSALAATSAIDQHIAVAETVGQALREGGVSHDRLTVIPNGVDAEGLFNPADISVDHVREELGLPAEGAILAFVGRLSSEKQPLAFVDLLQYLSKEMNVTGVMVGTGPLELKVSEHIKKLNIENQIKRISTIPRNFIPQLYAVADLLVITSEIEGLPLVALEALSMGCPVASTDVGDMKYLLQESKNGLLISTSKIICSSMQIKNFIFANKKYKIMRQNIRQSVFEKKYTKSDMLLEYEALFNNKAIYKQKVE